MFSNIHEESQVKSPTDWLSHPESDLQFHAHDYTRHNAAQFQSEVQGVPLSLNKNYENIRARILSHPSNARELHPFYSRLRKESLSAAPQPASSESLQRIGISSQPPEQQQSHPETDTENTPPEDSHLIDPQLPEYSGAASEYPNKPEQYVYL